MDIDPDAKYEDLCQDVDKENKEIAASSDKNIPKSVNYVGVGFNVIRATPDPEEARMSGGVEAGVLYTRRIFKMTYKKKRTSVDNSVQLPDQIEFATLRQCTKNQAMYYDARSYKKSSKNEIKMKGEAGVTAPFMEAAFSARAGIQNNKNARGMNSKVTFEKKTACELELVRYRESLVSKHGYKLTEDFYEAMCKLPAKFDEDSEEEYLRIMENWGTHVTLGIVAGFKRVEKSVATRKEVMTYAVSNIQSSVNVKATYNGGKAGLNFDMKKIEKSSDAMNAFSKSQDITCFGNRKNPSVLSVTLEPISIALKPEFWQGETCLTNHSELSVRHQSMKDALNKFPILKDIKLQKDESVVSIALQWPAGLYGLPHPKTGCPKKSDGFKWKKGKRIHATGKKNKWTENAHFGGKFSKSTMEQAFCVKTKQTPNALSWPQGKYCIYQSQKICPAGLQTGWVYWDENGDDAEIEGEVPYGKYEQKSTNISFCCRNDGYASNDIYLPTEKPFYLFPTSHQCQAVNGMTSSKEYFRWDDADIFNDNSRGGSTPSMKGDTNHKNTRIYFCYYTPGANSDE
ncbi:uncharacterized protein LOC141898887 [Tubulanus polymorphus]|uniref:uncharacterized protein LOC141898887 n=1 Tax=Tubulanus polymorphus TaxID=672921 RepID=UPI003DA25618